MTTVLVIGATGKVGRHVVSGLLDDGVGVRALTRHPETAALPAQVEVVEGDVGRPKTIEAAARGARSAFLLWPGFDPAGAGEVVAALADNVDHIVQLSSARLQREATGVTEGVWADVERLVEAVETTEDTRGIARGAGALRPGASASVRATSPPFWSALVAVLWRLARRRIGTISGQVTRLALNLLLRCSSRSHRLDSADGRHAQSRSQPGRTDVALRVATPLTGQGAREFIAAWRGCR